MIVLGIVLAYMILGIVGLAVYGDPDSQEHSTTPTTITFVEGEEQSTDMTVIHKTPVSDVTVWIFVVGVAIGSAAALIFTLWQATVVYRCRKYFNELAYRGTPNVRYQPA